MIVPGTECRKQQSGKNKQVWAAFSPVKKMSGNLFGVESQQEYQTPQANTCESQIGSHVTKMGQAQKTSLVREKVIFLGLRNSRQPESDRRHQGRENQQQHQARSA
jgi:hypothetical protein